MAKSEKCGIGSEGGTKKGDIISANRGLYKHYGVYNNDHSVIHFSPEEVVSRALMYTGKLRGDYDLVFNNCEHFAYWCTTGKLESGQVNTAVTVAATAVAAVAIGLGVKAIYDASKDSDEA